MSLAFQRYPSVCNCVPLRIFKSVSQYTVKSSYITSFCIHYFTSVWLFCCWNQRQCPHHILLWNLLHITPHLLAFNFGWPKCFQTAHALKSIKALTFENISVFTLNCTLCYMSMKNQKCCKLSLVFFPLAQSQVFFLCFEDLAWLSLDLNFLVIEGGGYDWL